MFAAASECDIRLTRDFASFIEKALERQMITLAEAEALAKADRPFNPKQYETARPGLSNYIRVFNSFLQMDAATWDVEREKIRTVVERRKKTQGIRGQAEEATAWLPDFETVRSFPAQYERAVDSFLTPEGRILALTYELSDRKHYRIRDPLVEKPLAAWRDQYNYSVPALGFDENWKIVIHSVLSTDNATYALIASDIYGDELGRQYLDVPWSGYNDMELLGDEHGIVMAFSSHSKRVFGWKIGGSLVEFKEARGMTLVRALNAGGRKIVLLEYGANEGKQYFAQFDGTSWRFLPHAPLARDLSVAGLLLSDGRFAVATLNSEGQGELVFAGNPPLKFSTGPGRVHRLGMYETPEKRILVWALMKIADSHFTLEIFEPAKGDVIRAFQSSEDGLVEIFSRGDRHYFAMTTREKVRIYPVFSHGADPLAAGVDGRADFDPASGGMRSGRTTIRHIYPLPNGDFKFVNFGALITTSNLFMRPQ